MIHEYNPGAMVNNKDKINDIVKLLKQAPNEKLRFELIELLFTPTELEQLVARYEIVRGLLAQHMTQRELAADLKLSIAKITRGSNELKRRSNALLTYLTRFLITKE